jgi:hypothetical protein
MQKKTEAQPLPSFFFTAWVLFFLKGIEKVTAAPERRVEYVFMLCS